MLEKHEEKHKLNWTTFKKTLKNTAIKQWRIKKKNNTNTWR